MSKLNIASNTYYSLSYDESKNRVYLSIKGFWPNEQVVSHYLKDWEHVLTLTQPKFTLVTNLSYAKIYTQDIMSIHEAAQRLIVNTGVLQVAEVLNESAFLEAQSKALIMKSQMPRNKFNSMADAEAWLDSLNR
ncbi:hypothetical protein SAMN05421780_10578 [Flexibacter flexilis DSM 6793]|uniref:SpoIIAA-like n=1 Tax=Flexibacter flexilis DSM 6793 TaxID=927664 RepID=A0A1I1IZW7_9BACT|nr:hypothetical protein [Flexibacter flexilis]SFC39203.1 hypothetical protein SAMN05421780_10578 [Flexibacter flexilis DSM 6793]